MKFLVHMRDGSRFTVEASYIEVVRAEESSYTFLGPVPGYPTAILASFPVELVMAVVPADQASGPSAPGGPSGKPAQPPKP